MLNLNQFANYLESQKFKVSSNLEYCWRIQKICEKENMTIDNLAENITTILKQYDKAGEKWCIGRRSHESYINALRNFRKFMLIQRFGGANA